MPEDRAAAQEDLRHNNRKGPHGSMDLPWVVIGVHCVSHAWVQTFLSLPRLHHENGHLHWDGEDGSYGHLSWRYMTYASLQSAKHAAKGGYICKVAITSFELNSLHFYLGHWACSTSNRRRQQRRFHAGGHLRDNFFFFSLRVEPAFRIEEIKRHRCAPLLCRIVSSSCWFSPVSLSSSSSATLPRPSQLVVLCLF